MVSNIAGLGGVIAPYAAPEIVQVREVLPNQNKKTVVERSMTVEEYVRGYFSDIPVMAEVAHCESRFRQHDSKGEVLRGEENRLDRGVMQINEFYHGIKAKQLGYDILAIEGNTAYARHLFEKSGLQPWVSSSKCWQGSAAYAEYKDLAINN